MARDRTFKITTYVFAGLSMMLNIRLTYSAAPYALLRFKLPENLFSVFVRTMAGALELWCLPSMLLGNIIDQIDKNVIDGGHEQRRFKDAPKYDVNGNILGERLSLKATELRDAANTLQTKAQSVGTLTDLASKAGLLASAAETLAGDTGTTSENAESVITNYKALDDSYESLGSDKANQDKVKSEFEAVKQIYDTILNVTKANKLKAEVGTKTGGAGQDKIWKKANELHTNANTLAIADGVSDKPELKGHVEALKKAIGATEHVPGLQKALQELRTASDTNDHKDLITRAQAVIDKYKEVKEAFEAVKAKSGEYNTALGAEYTQKYDPVTTAFQALKGAYDAAKCKAITPIFDKEWIRYCSIICTWSNFFTFVILFIVFITGGEQGHVTGFYWVMAASGFVFGINMVFVYAMELDFIVWYIAGENSFPIITSLMHYVSISLFGNRRKWNTDYIAVNVDMTISMCIALIAASLWTYCYIKPSTHQYFPPSSIKTHAISPALMIIVGMGLVFMIYPAIAPGMIVPFYLIDKIEMVLLVMTTFPPLLFASLREHYGFMDPHSPICEWSSTGAWGQGDGRFWHAFDILMPLQISLAVTFIYSLHYRDSNISRSIINQPKMSTFLSIVFYMCHEILLAIGFPGMVGNGGAGDKVMLPVQYAGALIMVFGGFVCNGYVTEYKRHDPSSWPTDGMTTWNAFCFWSKKTSKNTNKILASIFTTDLRRDLLLCIQKNELI